MLRSIDRYRDRIAALDFKADCPEVVQVLDEDQLCARLPEYDGWIIGDDPATARVFAAGAAGHLKAALKWGVGVDNVDFEGAQQAGIPIKNTPGMFNDEVADLTMAYVIALARELVGVSQGVWNGEWPKPVGISLKDKVAAVVGFGNIGQAVAERLLASKMRIQAYDPYYQPDAGLPASVAVCNWPEGIENADYVILCCSLTEANYHLLDSELLARCKRGVRVVNVSRGPLIDEQALGEALANGQVHSAALDVFENEPLPSKSSLRRFPKCIFGTHNASNTQEAVDRTSGLALDLLSELLAASSSGR